MRKVLLFCLLVFGYVTYSQKTHSRGVKAGDNPSQEGQTFALVIGISDYQNLPKLKFADRDAEIFANYLVTAAHVPIQNVKLFRNKEANKVSIEYEIGNLKKRLKPNDKVFLYFAGHADIERTDKNEYAALLLTRSDVKNYANDVDNNIQLSQIRTWLDDLFVQKKAKTYFISDACRSGAFTLIGGTDGKNRTISGMQEEWSNQFKALACEPTEVAFEDERWGNGRGVFSYALVRGLTGYADKNNDNNISWGELKKYLTEEVPNLTKPDSQNPVIEGKSTDFLVEVDTVVFDKLKKTKEAIFPMFSKLVFKGWEDNILVKKSLEIKELYKKFKQAIQENKLIGSKSDCAYYFYEKLLNANPKDEGFRGHITSEIVVALQNKAMTILKPMVDNFTEDNKILSDSLKKINHNNRIQASLELDAALKIIGVSNTLYNNLLARKLFLDAQNLTYDNIFDDKNATQALNLLKISEELESDMIYTYVGLATFYVLKTQLDSSLYFIQKCHQILPNNLVIKRYLADQYDARRDTTLCLPMYREILSAEPDNINVLESLYGIYSDNLRGTQKEKAKPLFDKLYTIYHENLAKSVEKNEKIKYSVKLSALLQKSGDLESSLNYLQSAQKMDSSDVELMNKLANILEKLKRFDEAIYWSKKVVSKQPSAATYHYSLGMNYAMKLLNEVNLQQDKGINKRPNFNDMPDFLNAVKEFRESIKINPNYVSGQSILTSLFIYAGKYKEALPSAIKGVELDRQGNFQNLTNLLKIYSEIGDTLNVEKICIKADSIVVNSQTLKNSIKGANLITIAQSLAKVNRLERAIEVAKRGIKLDSTDAISNIILGKIFYQNKQYQEAIIAYTRVENLPFGIYHFHALSNKGNAILAKKDSIQAIETWKKCLSMQSQLKIDSIVLSPVLTNISKIYDELNRKAEALEYAQKLVQFDKKNTDNYLLLARTYRKNEKFEEAIQTANQGCAIKDSPDFYVSLGKTYFANGKKKDALHNFEKAILKSDKSTEFWQRIATDPELTKFTSSTAFKKLTLKYFPEKN